MLHEALKFLTDLGAEAAASTIIDIPGDPRRVLLDRRDGSPAEFITIPAGDRAHRVNTLDDLIHATETWTEANRVIFHNHEKVVLVLDDDDRRDLVTLNLIQSEPFKTLCKLAEKLNRTQAEMVRLLKVDLYGCAEERILPIIRNIKFTQTSSGGGNLQHGRDTLGRQVDAAVAGVAETIPEYFHCNAPIYMNPGCAAIQSCVISLDINTADSSFALKPMPDHLLQMIAGAQQDIHDRLIESLGDDVQIFNGSL